MELQESKPSLGYSEAHQDHTCQRAPVLQTSWLLLDCPDIARIAALGVKAYSFSISWSRVMPFGRGPVNEQAMAHYMDLIDTCIEYNVEPIVTL